MAVLVPRPNKGRLIHLSRINTYTDADDSRRLAAPRPYCPGHIRIDPYDPALVQSNSVDIRHGNHFVWYKPFSDVIDPYNRRTVSTGIEETRAETFILNPGRFVLAETLECIGLPDNIVATIEGKSSIACLGLTLHQTGGRIDAGFRGTITLEMANVNSRPVKVYAGMPVGQLVFYTTERAENPYDKKADAKYLNQHSATLSRYHGNRRRKSRG